MVSGILQKGGSLHSNVSIVWFRQDLRLADHPALSAAVERGGPVLPVFIWSTGDEGAWPPGAASRWWLHRSLASLDRALRQRGSRLILRQGAGEEVLRSMARETGARAVFCSRRLDPAGIAVETGVARSLAEDGVSLESVHTSFLHDPWQVRGVSGQPFRVFTPFWKHCVRTLKPSFPLAVPRKIPAPRRWPRSQSLAELGLEPRVDWAAGLRASWQPGEEGAARHLRAFVKEAVAAYPRDRDRPSISGTSRLSPHLHFGEISPRQVLRAVEAHAAQHGGPGTVGGSESYLRQLYWREFAQHLLYHYPKTDNRPLRPEFARFPWRRDRKALRAWQKGLTGYPIVDAGMRELWATGWMHNRVRMIAASFLVKDLLISWKEGARWFWDTLVDADLANNTLGWQWTAGCGADAAPFFRIFNPVLQGRKFDPEGAYVRRWIPEIARLPDGWIHRPWEAPESVLDEAGVVMGSSYPAPIVDHHAARRRALEALAAVRTRRRA